MWPCNYETTTLFNKNKDIMIWRCMRGYMMLQTSLIPHSHQPSVFVRLADWEKIKSLLSWGNSYSSNEIPGSTKSLWEATRRMGVALSGNASRPFFSSLLRSWRKSRLFIFVLTLVAIFRRWWFPPRDQGFEKADGATGALVRKYLASADLEGSEKEPLKARSKTIKVSGLMAHHRWTPKWVHFTGAYGRILSGEISLILPIRCETYVFLLASSGWTEPQCPGWSQICVSLTRVRLFHYISQNDCMSIHQRSSDSFRQYMSLL